MSVLGLKWYARTPQSCWPRRPWENIGTQEYFQSRPSLIWLFLHSPPLRVMGWTSQLVSIGQMGETERESGKESPKGILTEKKDSGILLFKAHRIGHWGLTPGKEKAVVVTEQRLIVTLKPQLLGKTSLPCLYMSTDLQFLLTLGQYLEDKSQRKWFSGSSSTTIKADARKRLQHWKWG